MLSVRDVQGQRSLHCPCCVRPLEREAGTGLCAFKRGRRELEPRGCVFNTVLILFRYLFLFCFLRADFTVLCIIHN